MRGWDGLAFSLRRASLTGRETAVEGVEGVGGVVVDIVAALDLLLSRSRRNEVGTWSTALSAASRVAGTRCAGSIGRRGLESAVYSRPSIRDWPIEV